MFKNKKIKRPFVSDLEPHEIFLDNLAQKKEAELGISEKRFEVPLSGRILKIFFFSAMVLIFSLFFKTFQLQALRHKDFLVRAQENKFIIRSIQSSRGVIYDSKGVQLVFNKSSFDLVVDKREMPEFEPERNEVLAEISTILGVNADDLKEKLSLSKDDQVLISENLDQQKLILLETKIVDLPGFEIKKNYTRDYKDGSVFAHIIGYTGQINAQDLREKPGLYSVLDYIGKDGVEKSYEDVLRRNPGELKIVRDARGYIISKEVSSLPEPGDSLVLWLDADLQRKIDQELKKILENVGAQKAAAVALDPKTGGVLALVSIPGFDNNIFSKGGNQGDVKNILQDPSHPLYNRVISGNYPTGSTIKPLTASAALQEKILSPSKIIDCPGKICVPNRYDPTIVYDYNDWRAHGLVDMRTAIAESCNVYFYTIGGGYGSQKGLGPSNIKKYLELFGWGRKTGIDLPAESDGFIPSPEWKKTKKGEGWWDGDTYNLSIGQGDIGITPLQVAASFAAIANGGTLYKPSVVKEVIDSNKDIVEEIQPKILNNGFIDGENLKIVREGMRWGVTGENSPFASSVILNSLPVPAAAKTGTAQIGNTGYYYTWVSVFAPYDDPKIVLTVLIEKVKIEGQLTVLPVAKEVLDWYFTDK